MRIGLKKQAVILIIAVLPILLVFFINSQRHPYCNLPFPAKGGPDCGYTYSYPIFEKLYPVSNKVAYVWSLEPLIGNLRNVEWLYNFALNFPIWLIRTLAFVFIALFWVAIINIFYWLYKLVKEQLRHHFKRKEYVKKN